MAPSPSPSVSSRISRGGGSRSRGTRDVLSRLSNRPGTPADHEPRTMDAGGMRVDPATGRYHAMSATSSISDSSEGGEGGKAAMFETGDGCLGTTSRLLEIKFRRRWEIQDSILDTIGQTPIVRLRRMAPAGVDIYCKIEGMNPGGSSMDRMALGIIEFAEATGRLQPGQTVIEASSGNAGISLAMVCAVKGYPFVCVMGESFSTERRKIMRFYGAKVILTKAAHKVTGMLTKAQELADSHGFYYPKQFESEANCWIHEHTTGPEICKAFAQSGRPLDHFFMAYGTGGTILGISRAFKKARMSTKIHLCEPSNAPIVTSAIATKYPKEGEGGVSTSFDTSHPIWSPHHLQGWAGDFIPKLVATAKSEKGYHAISRVSSAAAIEAARELARKEGIFTGISGGGILAAALAHAKEAKPGTAILCILPDTGERYLSTILFDGIPEGMTNVCQTLSSSTPGYVPPSRTILMPEDTDDLFFD